MRVAIKKNDQHLAVGFRCWQLKSAMTISTSVLLLLKTTKIRLFRAPSSAITPFVGQRNPERSDSAAPQD